ncbi:MAG: DinB family protein [Flavobacteriales bacterium]|nr:DinB family protein [Flavobacteriales bacterium]
MTKEEIKSLLEGAYKQLIGFVDNADEEYLAFGPEEKWTVSQHLEHLRKSASMLNKGLSMPGMVLKPMFGTANRPSKTNEQLRTRYDEKVAVATGAPPADSQPRPHSEMNIERLISGIKKEYDKLFEHLEKWSEEDLDKYILPHPLLGKCTLREMYYFTAYHTELHTKTVNVTYRALKV